MLAKSCSRHQDFITLDAFERSSGTFSGVWIFLVIDTAVIFALSGP